VGQNIGREVPIAGRPLSAPEVVEFRGGSSWGPPGIAGTGYTVPIDDKLRWSINALLAGRSYSASLAPADWHRFLGVPVHPPFPRGAAPASAQPAVHSLLCRGTAHVGCHPCGAAAGCALSPCRVLLVWICC
jgi:hypothetical protein